MKSNIVYFRIQTVKSPHQSVCITGEIGILMELIVQKGNYVFFFSVALSENPRCLQNIIWVGLHWFQLDKDMKPGGNYNNLEKNSHCMGTLFQDRNNYCYYRTVNSL